MDRQPTFRSLRRKMTLAVLSFTAIALATPASMLAQDPLSELRYRDLPSEPTGEASRASFEREDSPGTIPQIKRIDSSTTIEPYTGVDSTGSARKPVPNASTKSTGDAEPGSVIQLMQNFNPGEYSIDDLIAVLGKPMVEKTTLDGETHVFRIEPFSSLSTHSVAGKIMRIKGELAQAQPLIEFREQWSLTELTGAIVPDSRANAIGQAYPELGLVVYFKKNAKRPLVSQIDLRPLAAQPFLWRVQHGYEYSYADRFADLDQAAKIDARNGDIHWIRAELLLELERPTEALREIETALQTSVAAPRYRITKGRALLGQGLAKEALAEFRVVAEAEGVSAMDRAAAETEWGRVLAMGAKANYPASMLHHQKAIEYVSQAARELGPMASRTMQRILIDAHFGGAKAVAVGPWKGGDSAARQWLVKANTFSKIFVEREKGDPVVALESHRRSIEVLESLKEDSNVGELLQQVEKEADLLLGAIGDEAAHDRLEWELAQIYFRAARMLRKQGKMESVNKYYSKSYELIRKQEDEREATPAFNYQLGNIHFFAGSLYAVNQDDHAKAMPIYQRALTYYSRPLGPVMLSESGLQGERYVSMGVTFWQSGQKEQAVALSEAGLQLMEQAASRNELPRSELAVPYNNLAHMKSAIGEASEALKYQRVAAEITSDETR